MRVLKIELFFVLLLMHLHMYGSSSLTSKHTNSSILVPQSVMSCKNSSYIPKKVKKIVK